MMSAVKNPTTPNPDGQPRALCGLCGKPALVTPHRTITDEVTGEVTAYHRPCHINAMKRINAARNA